MKRAPALVFFFLLIMVTLFPGCTTINQLLSKSNDPHPWNRHVVFFYIDASLPATILTQEFEQAVIDSFGEWNNLFCADWPMFIYGGRRHAKLVQQDDCKPECTIPIKNAIFVTVRHKNWDDETKYLGVAYSYFNTRTGQRIATGIALNFVNYRYADLGKAVPGNANDLKRLVVHEAGHAVGVRHHDVPSEKLIMSEFAYEGPYQGLAPEDIEHACPKEKQLSAVVYTNTTK